MTSQNTARHEQRLTAIYCQCIEAVEMAIVNNDNVEAVDIWKHAMTKLDRMFPSQNQLTDDQLDIVCAMWQRLESGHMLTVQGELDQLDDLFFDHGLHSLTGAVCTLVDHAVDMAKSQPDSRVVAIMDINNNIHSVK